MAKSKDLVVGLFVLAGIAFCALVIFLLGDEKRLFETQMVLETSFVDVQGLKAGAPVRMGGIDIGTVEQVGFGEKAEDSNIYVRMSIVRSEARRIKTDSKARVQTRGLLGDKMIEITLGVDGRAYMRVRNDQPGGRGAWPFDSPFYLILNLAMGGDWAAAKGMDDAALPQRMEVDYVRVWRAPRK